jgi:hypothetical protein
MDADGLQNRQNEDAAKEKIDHKTLLLQGGTPSSQQKYT